MTIIKKWGIILFCFAFGLSFLVSSQISSAVNQESFFYPKALSIIFLVLTVLLIVQIAFDKKIEDFTVNWVSLGLLISYLLVMYTIGFLIATALFLPITMFFMGERSIKRLLVLDCCITLAVYTIFKFVFNVPVYGGLFW